VAVIFAHVDDLLLARRDGHPQLQEVCAALVKDLHLVRKDAAQWLFCGKETRAMPNAFHVSTKKVLGSLEREPPSVPRRPVESILAPAERADYLAGVGSLNYAVTWTRWDLAADVNFRSQRTSVATVADMKILTKLVAEAMQTRDQGVVLRRGLVDITKRFSVIGWGGSAFANAPGEKSQCGLAFCVAEHPAQVVGECRFSLAVPLMATSSTVKRVARSTLAAEGYAISEASEIVQYIRHVLADLSSGCRLRMDELEARAGAIPGLVLTDSDNWNKTVGRDAGTVQDKRLRIVVSALRQVFGDPSRGLTLRWVPTHLMVPDALTKQMDKGMVRAFMHAEAFAAKAAKASGLEAGGSPLILLDG
jgi:hypothetical protein